MRFDGAEYHFYQTLQDAIAESDGTNASPDRIFILADIAQTQTITLTGKHISLESHSENGATYTITRTNPTVSGLEFTGCLFDIEPGSSLALGAADAGQGIVSGIIIDGGADLTNVNGGIVATDSLIKVAGTFMLHNDAVLQNNNLLSLEGGAVLIYNDGVFTMTGGLISGNTAFNISDWMGEIEPPGIGVYLLSGTFSMSGSAFIDAGNEVYLATEKTIEINGNLTSPYAARITPAWYDTTTQVLSGSAVGANYGKFGLTNNGSTSDWWCINSSGYLTQSTELDPIATGGEVTYAFDETLGKIDEIHTFTENGALTFPYTPNINNASVLVIAGGGGGGYSAGNDFPGGGGGAGGFVYREKSRRITSAYTTVIVGAGGAGGTAPATAHNSGIGGNSSFGTVSALGGGGGGSHGDGVAPFGKPGGSGGGSSGTGTPGQGHNGGICVDWNAANSAGGGGGAGEDAASYQYGTLPGTGGIGRSCSITGVPVMYAGGGGSGGVLGLVPGSGGLGGLGGGGSGGPNPTQGEDGKGGGGGGGDAGSGGAPGGSGIVIVRFIR
jgi:hypothetical protein